MILYLVNQLTGVLQSHAHRNTLGLNLNLSFSQIAVNITCRVSRSQDNRSAILFIGYTAHDGIALQYQLSHLGLEVHFATAVNDGISHRLDHLWQSVGTNMRMRIGQDSRRGTMLTEHIQNFLDITTLFAACVQFTVAIGTGATLTKAVVTLTVNLLRAADVGQILLTVVHVLTALQYNRA